MSKNFETEYKKYADNTVPDLWSRIEAGVDAYEESIKEHFAFIGWDVSFLPGGYSKTRVRTLLS